MKTLSRDPPAEVEAVGIEGLRRMSHRRPLGRFEEALTASADYAPFNVVAVLGLCSSPPVEAVERALRGLQARHALLAARLVDEPADRGRRRHAFLAGGTPPIPLRRAAGRREGSWQAVVEDELNRGFDRAAGPLARAVYLPSPTATGPSEIVLALHHAVVDAPSLMALLEELLARLRGEEPPGAGEAAGDPPLLPPAADAAFPPPFRGRSRWRPLGRFLLRQLAGELAYRWRTRGRRPPPAPADARCRVLSTALSPAATTALVRSSRRRRVTLASAASAAILLAVVRRRYGGRALPHRYFVFPDLRPRLRPPAPPSVLAAYLSMMRLTVEVEGGMELWELGRRIQEQLHAAVRRGERFLAALAAPGMMRAVLRWPSVRMGTAAVSYAGPVSLGGPDHAADPERIVGPATGELRVTALHAFVSNLHLGPEYTAQARLFDRRLWWDVVYLDRDMEPAEARALAGEIRSILEAAGGRG